MIKKLHKHLLENYPLLWNMRLVGILAIILLIHLVHFAIGYFSFTNIEKMGWNGPEDMFFDSTFGMFSIVGSFIVFILWLMRVLRNNGFKSFYPFSSTQLFVQFIIFVVVSFLNISYYFSFTEGYALSGRNHTDLAANKKDAETYNNILPFTIASKGGYNIENRCAPFPFPMSKKFWSDTNKVETEHNDGVLEGAVVEEVSHTVTVETEVDSVYQNSYYYLGKDDIKYSQAQLDSMTEGEEYSYLNTCENDHFDKDYLNQGMIHLEDDRLGNSKTLRELLLHNPSQIKVRMETFIQLCNKYKVRYSLDANEWYKWVNNPPHFPVKYTIENQYFNPRYDDYATVESSDFVEATPENELNPKGYFVQLNKLEGIIDNTFKVHYYHISYPVVMILLHLAFGFSLLIFTFRASSKKVWLITFIGSFLISMIVGALTALIASTTIAVFVFYLCIIALFLVVHLIANRKTIAGAALNWFVWTAPLVLPLIYAIYNEHERQIENKAKAFEYQKPALRMWVEDNITTAFGLCLLAYLILIYILMPRYRRWQAMPED